MRQQEPHPRGFWSLPGPAHLARAWSWVTEPPANITEPRLRQQARLHSILSLSGLMGGLLGFTISHYGLMPGHSLLENPTIGVSLACDVLVLASYFLGRRQETLRFASILLVVVVVGGSLISIITDPSDYYALVIYIVVAQVFASLLLSPWGTRITLMATFVGLALLPLISPEISILTTIHILGPIFVVSIMIGIGVTVRQRDLRTIEQQALLLARAKQQAESANQLKSVFLGMVSHELRTPLNNIMGYSDQILMGLTGDRSPQTIEAADRIHRNGEQLKRMITDLLTLSRIEGGSLTIIHKPYALADLVGEVDQSFREQAEGKGLEFITYVAEAVPAVIIGDRERVAQILFNLVSNAVKFTDQGRIVIWVGQLSSDKWSVSVEDTGIGVPPGALERIFDRFYQLDTGSRRSFGGAGLGLAIAKELAVLMGGSITVRSKPGAGSIFTVVLPYVSEESTRAVTPPSGLTRGARSTE